jgi:hypothetical protein
MNMNIMIVDDETDIESLFRQKFKNEIKRRDIIEFPLFLLR